MFNFFKKKEIKIGDVLKLKHDNPFIGEIKIKILNIKGEYCQYVHIGSESVIFSNKISYITFLYEYEKEN